ncbi:MAG TPA: hypothetical protein VMW75_27810 [Thermoanaerobaculia bacterium]|nr:hypothetical protein [Thermoanaerobaculia bacterium]
MASQQAASASSMSWGETFKEYRERAREPPRVTPPPGLGDVSGIVVGNLDRRALPGLR